MVAVDEIGEVFGDNDRLSALVANLIDADLLVILSDVDGLYTADPRRNPNAQLVSVVDVVDDRIQAMVGEHQNPWARGGMPTKIDAARLVTSAGIAMSLCSGREENALIRAARGEGIGTLFQPAGEKMEARKRWMLNRVKDSQWGEIEVDGGAADALLNRHVSLLPAGVRGVRGDFHRGDIVYIVDEPGRHIACGIAKLRRRGYFPDSWIPVGWNYVHSWVPLRAGSGAPEQPGAHLTPALIRTLLMTEPPGGHMATTADKEMLLAQGKTAQTAARQLARTSTEMKDQALLNVANALETEQEPILAGNRRDYDTAKAGGMDDAMLDRLLLTPDRLLGMASDVRTIAGLPDPVEEVIDRKTLANGLEVERRRVPLGVIGSIYESRPNITVDIAALTLKSGNACLLRGGRESLHSNLALVGLLRRSIGEAGINPDVVQYVDNPDRELVDTMLQMKEYINLLVPRGGAGLINFVAASAAMPVVSGGVGVCHTYVDRTADLEKAANIVFNAKVQRPTVCNALDTVLVHSEVAPGCLPDRLPATCRKPALNCTATTGALSILGPEPDLNTQPATEEDWGKEFLSLTAAIKIVDSLDEALEHIDTYGSGHTEAIITSDADASRRFQRDVDAAAVIVNASSRFTDGGQLGLGAEVGISTQKFHARGPLGLAELTSYKWVIIGDGQVRE